MSDVEVGATSRFERGEHLRVLRRGVYWHHGIYVSDQRVFEFGGGGLLAKDQSIIREVSLDKFDLLGRDRADAVGHPREVHARRLGYPGTCTRLAIVSWP
jgi:lecithin:retinol acyltransferase